MAPVRVTLEKLDREPAPAKVHSAPDCVVGRIGRLEVMVAEAGGLVALLEVGKAVSHPPQADLGDGLEIERPSSLEGSSRLLCDLMGASRVGEAGVGVGVEGGQAGEADVGQGQPRTWPERLQLFPRPLEVLAGEVGPLELPVAAAKHQAVAGGLPHLAGRFQPRDAFLQQLAGKSRLGVLPARLAGHAHQPAGLDRFGGVGQRSFQELRGVAKGERAAGLGGRLLAHGHRFREASSQQQVLRAVGGGRVGLPGQHVGQAVVHLAPAGRHQVLVDGLPGQGVAEPVGGGLPVVLLQQLVEDAGLQSCRDGGLVATGQRNQGREIERAAHDRGRSDHLGGLRAQALDPQQDRVADGRRDPQPELNHRLAVPAGLVLEDVAAVEGVLEHLLDDEGVALGPEMEEVLKLRADLLLVEDRTDHPADLGRVEGAQLHLPDARPAPALHGR